MNENSLKSALGLSVSVLATEHYFSASMSSPWSVDKFTQTDEDKRKVWALFNESVYASLIFAVVIAYMLKSWWPIIGAILVIAHYYSLYKRATEHTL